MQNPQPRRFRRPFHSFRGFSTIELLVVIGILTVIIGFLFVAGRKLISGNREKETRVTLNNLQAMLGELEAADGLRRQPGGWLWSNGTAFAKVLRDPYDFWRNPFWVTDPGEPDSLISPGQFVESQPANRNAGVAIVNTSLAISLLASVPANRTRLQSMPQSQQFTPTWTADSVTLPGADQYMTYLNDGAANAQYIQGMHVRYQDHYFVATATLPANGNPAPVLDATTGAWIDETKAPFHAPLLKDSWDNPIIFVPGSGLRVRLLNGKDKLEPNDRAQNWIIVSSEGAVSNNGNASTDAQVTRPGRPFFASAGPDGDFSAGDDNLYSFEK